MANFSSRLSPLTVSVPVVTDGITYSPTLTNLGNATSSFEYSRNGQFMQIRGTIIIGSTLPTGPLKFSLPSGFSADYSLVPKGFLNTDAYQCVGTAVAFKGVQYWGEVQRDNTSLTTFNIASQAGDWNISIPVTWAAGDTIQIDLKVRISGWTANTFAGSNLNAIVNGGNSYGSALTIGTNDAFGLNLETNGTTKLSIDTAGAVTLGPSSTASHATLSHKFFGNELNVNNDGNNVNAILRLQGGSTGGGTTSSIAAISYRANGFSGYWVAGQANTAALSGGPFAWSFNSAADFGSAVYGQISTAGAWTLGPTSAIGGSTFPGNNIVGKTNGSAISAGYVGERITWTSPPSTQAATTTETDWTNATITLTPGVWEVKAFVQTVYNTGTTAGNNGSTTVKITDSSNTVVQEMDKRVYAITPAAASTAAWSCLAFGFVTNVSTSTTYKLRVIRADAAGTGTGQVRNEANDRSQFYAVRIA